MKIKLVSELKGEHIHERVFIGDGETLALAGTLVFHIGEWQIFGAALSLGAARTQGRLTVEFVGDDAVTRVML